MRIVVCIPVALMCACGGSNSTTGPAPAIDVSGTWNATWTSGPGEIFQGTLTLSQTGARVTGSAVASGSPCGQNGDINASINGDELTGTMAAGAASVTFDTTVGVSMMSGTFDVVSAGACTGDTGTITATR
jgi:hypothetical protein